MIYVNNNPYDVDYVSFNRSVTIDRKYDLVTADGVHHSEILGQYIVYDVEIGNISDEVYNTLRAEFLSSPDYVQLSMPEAQDRYYTFSGIVTSLSDSMIADPPEYDTHRKWDNLHVTLESRQPYFPEVMA